MYEVRLPVPLLANYVAYRQSMLNGSNVLASTEYELFHGTGRQCLLGEEPHLTKLCSNSKCRMCRVLTTSFSIKKAGSAPGRSFLRFGHGVYTSSVSSKADDYTATPSESKYKAMLVARVVLGKGYPLKLTTAHLTGPPSGYDSVIGQVGLHLNYDEQVVYREEAVRPAYLIIYKY
ncbi:hypothetical protein FRB90_010788 [Tulasnella sp. 427]|nr:hypothetical protein FRB90_010788 [Tulasnella sp. 427]